MLMSASLAPRAVRSSRRPEESTAWIKATPRGSPSSARPSMAPATRLCSCEPRRGVHRHLVVGIVEQTQQDRGRGRAARRDKQPWHVAPAEIGGVAEDALERGLQGVAEARQGVERRRDDGDAVGVPCVLDRVQQRRDGARVAGLAQQPRGLRARTRPAPPAAERGDQ